MNRDLGFLFGPLVAIVLLAVVLWHTGTALQDTGAFRGNAAPTANAATDPYVALDRRLGDVPPASADPIRDPFGGPAVVAATTPDTARVRRVTPKLPPKPVPPALPTLTAIVFDNDPRAIVHWNGRDWDVRQNALFDVFQVVSISRDQVVLRRGDESIVLKRPQGD